MENILNKVIEIEDYKGNTILSFEIDCNGNIIQYENGEIADIAEDYVFNSNKELVRIQQIKEV